MDKNERYQQHPRGEERKLSKSCQLYLTHTTVPPQWQVGSISSKERVEKWVLKTTQQNDEIALLLNELEDVGCDIAVHAQEIKKNIVKYEFLTKEHG